MACYKRFRGLCTLWCSIEIVLFSGIIYGWSSLVFIFIEEGFYSDLCTIINDEDTLYSDANNSTFNNQQLEVITVTLNLTKLPGRNSIDCADQESRLGLWFSIGVGCTWAGMAILGPLSKALGTRLTRLITLFLYEAGLFCLAFATVDTPWLICPGLCCIGIAGLAHFASNIQVANLYTTFSSTVVALFCGLFDSSSIIFQLVKVAYGVGIGRRDALLFLACLHLLMIGTSTFLILPKCYIHGPTKELNIDIHVSDDTELSFKEIQPEKKVSSSSTGQLGLKRSVWYHLTSATYVAHVTWMTVNCLLFTTFLNLLHIRVDKLTQGDTYVAGYYLGVFAYTTMGSVIGSIIAGMIYDSERKRYRDFPFPQNKWRPVVIPMIACGIFIAAVFSFMLYESVTFLVPCFVLFTLFRNFLFSTGIAFVNDGFPTEYFGHLYGIMTFINGLFSLLQYGFVKWTVSFSEAHKQVNVVLILLAVLTFAHPLQLWFRSKRQLDTKPEGVIVRKALIPDENENADTSKYSDVNVCDTVDEVI